MSAGTTELNEVTEMGAETMTMDDLREELAMAGARIVRKYKEGEPIDGHYVRMEETDDGRRWWLEPVGGEADSEPEREAVEAVAEEPPELTVEWLTAIKGVGKKSARRIIDEGHETFADLADLDDLTDLPGIGAKNGPNLREALDAETDDAGADSLEEARAELTDAILERIDSEGVADIARQRVNDGTYDDALQSDADIEVVAENAATYCRALVEKKTSQEGEQEDEQTSQEGSAYPEWVYDLGPHDLSLTKKAIDAARAEGQTPRTDGMGAKAKVRFKEWLDDRSKNEQPQDTDSSDPCPEQSDKPPFETPSNGIEIRCPYCDGLFDRAPAGAYRTGEAHCENFPELSPDDRGDCGARFWIVATDDGYEVYADKPDDDSEGEVIEGPEKGSGDDDQPEDEIGGDDESTDIAPATYAEEAGVESGDDWIDDATELLDEPKTDDTDTTDEPNNLTWPDEEPSPQTPVVPQADRPHPSLPDCRAVAHHTAGTDAWHNARAKGIGSSDAGAILGFDPHSTRQDVWRTKVGEDVDDKPWLSEYAEFGRWFEGYIRQWCADEHGAEIIPGEDLGTLESARWPVARANIDGLDVTTGVVEEIKTTEDEWTSPPDRYEAQVQHQLYVTGAREGRIRQYISPVPRTLIPSLRDQFRQVALVDAEADRLLADWLLEHGEVHTWIIERDEQFIDRLIAQERRFWEFVEQEVVPPAADPEGTVDLTEDHPEVYSAMCAYARKKAAAEDVKDVIDSKDEAKKRAKKAIKKAVALTDDDPKRVRVGDHKATLIEKEKYSYWRIYAGDDDGIPW